MSFKNPDLVNYGPTPFWFWNDRLQSKRIQSQIQLMGQAGIRNFLIHARWGLQTPYLSKEWWNRIDTALAMAGKSGSRVWLYDEYNYPSGICGFKITRQEKYREKYLVPVTQTAKAGSEVLLTLPQGIAVAAYCYPIKGAVIDEKNGIDITAHITNRNLRYQPVGITSFRIYIFIMQTEAYEGWGKYSVNYLDKEPTREFIRLTHERYHHRYGKLFGSKIPYFFLDEPRFNNAIPWSLELRSFFKKEKGYDPLPYLALLCEDGSVMTTRFRCDFYDIISEMYRTHFFKPIGDWCRKYKIGLTGHLMAEETLGGNTRYSGHGMKHYQHFSMPGVDHLGRGIGGIGPKLTASAAHHLGNRAVSCEVFAGCGWDFTMEKMNTITHWLFCQGVNRIIPHAFFYSTRGNRKNDWPPSLFYQWKDWKKIPAYASRVARLAELFSGGHHAADIALYYPIESYHAAYQVDTNYKTGYNDRGPRVTKKAFAIEETYQKIAHALRTQHLDYDIVDAATLNSLSIKNSRLVCEISKERYSLLILPYVTTISHESARKISSFASTGGSVLILGALPAHALQIENDSKIKAQFKSLLSSQKSLARYLPYLSFTNQKVKQSIRLIKQLLKQPDIELSGSSKLIGEYLELDQRIHDPYIHSNLDELLRKKQGGVSAYHYIKNGKHQFLFANLVPETQVFSCRFRDQLSNRIRFLHPGSGNEISIDAQLIASVKKSNSLSITIPPLEAVVVEFNQMQVKG